QPDLLSIAAGELSQRTLEVGVEALGQRLGTANSLDPAQPCEQPQRLAAARLPAEAEIAGEIAEPRADRDAVATAVEAEETGAAAGRVVKGEEVAPGLLRHQPAEGGLEGDGQGEPGTADSQSLGSAAERPAPLQEAEVGREGGDRGQHRDAVGGFLLEPAAVDRFAADPVGDADSRGTDPGEEPPLTERSRERHRGSMDQPMRSILLLRAALVTAGGQVLISAGAIAAVGRSLRDAL